MAKLFSVGTIDGVEFTKAGSFTNDAGEVVTYGDSVRLQFSTIVDIEKQGIKTKAKRTYKIYAPMRGDVESTVNYYNGLIGKEVQCDIVPTDGQTFHINGEVKVNK